MKIIQVTPYYNPHLGGMEKRVRNLCERLSKKGNHVEVFTSNINCPKDKQLKSSNNLKINYLNSGVFANTAVIPSLFFKLMKIQADSIIHANMVDAFTPNFVYLTSKIRKIPYISHIPGDAGPKGFFSFLLEPYKKVFLSKIIRNSGAVICLNKDYKNFIIKKYNVDPKKIVIIPNATDFEIVSQVRLNRNDKKNILFVGRLSIEKNIDKIIEAFSILKDKNILLNIVGEGEKEKELKELVDKYNLKNINFLGRLEGEKLYKMYIKSDIFLLPSKYECFSHTLLEAMTTGIPIIASDIPGTRNVIKNGYNGLLVEPTPEKIAEAIEKLIKNPKLREKLARNGLKEVKKYSWDKIVEQTEKVYEEVLCEHNKKLKQKKK